MPKPVIAIALIVAQKALLPQSRQLLEQMPVLQPLLLGPEQQLRGIAVLIKVLGEAPFAAREVDERHLFI